MVSAVVFSSTAIVRIVGNSPYGNAPSLICVLNTSDSVSILFDAGMCVLCLLFCYSYLTHTMYMSSCKRLVVREYNIVFGWRQGFALFGLLCLVARRDVGGVGRETK